MFVILKRKQVMHACDAVLCHSYFVLWFLSSYFVLASGVSSAQLSRWWTRCFRVSSALTACSLFNYIPSIVFRLETQTPSVLIGTSDCYRYLGLATSTTESRAASSKKSKERDSRVSPVKKSQPVAISSASVQHPIITVTEPNITPSASRVMFLLIGN